MIHGLIFAGGTGTRIKNSDIPKQFIKINNKPIIIHTLEHFSINERIDDITVVCVKEWISYLKEIIDEYSINKIESIIPGGLSGYESIHLGLIDISSRHSEEDIVLICDGVRPVISEKLINECIDITYEYGNAVPVVRSIDSVIISKNGLYADENFPRENVYITQAPQGYYLKDIIEAHKEAEQRKLVNPISSADLMIDLGGKVRLFAGDRNNIKVTTDDDLINVESYFEYMKK